MTLSEYHKYIRKSRKIKLTAMSRDLGITASSISRYECSLTAPSITEIERRFDYLGFRLVVVDKKILPE
jgi:transcriptional regulator with XRE-family HTH domain